jgi:hypothetical protein
VVAQEVVKLLKRVGKILIASAIHDVQSLARVRVKELQMILPACGIFLTARPNRRQKVN